MDVQHGSRNRSSHSATLPEWLQQLLSHSVTQSGSAATQPLTQSEWLGQPLSHLRAQSKWNITDYYSMTRFQGYVKILWTYPTPLHSQILRKVSVFLSFARLWSALPWRRCQRSTRVSALPAIERSWTLSSPNVHFIHCFISKFVEFCRCVNPL